MERGLSIRSIVWPLLALPFFGCAAPAASPAPDDHPQVAQMDVLQSIVTLALADAAQRTGRDASTLVVVSAERVTWPDGSIGCPRPGMQYPQALVPGFRVRIRAGGDVLDYHAGRSGPPFHCPAGRATEPASGNSRI